MNTFFHSSLSSQKSSSAPAAMMNIYANRQCFPTHFPDQLEKLRYESLGYLVSSEYKDY